MSVKAFARRYGVDCYTACADLIAIGFCLAPGEKPLGGSADSRAEAAAGRAC